MESQEHPFSWQAISRIIISGLSLYFIWKLSGTIILIIVSLMMAAAFYPIAKRLNHRMPFTLATILAMFLLVVPFIIIAVTVIPSLIIQWPNLLNTVNNLINNSKILPASVRNIDLTQYAQSGGSYLLQSTTIITNIMTSIIISLFLTFYFIIDATRLMNLFLLIFPPKEHKRVRGLFADLARINGQYIRGNLLISLICGVIIFVGLLMLRVPFALPLALFAAILDLLPLLGATIGMIPAAIIGFSMSPFTGILVVLLYVAYQQIEGAVIAPAIYNKALKLSPALSFVAVIIGSALFGIIGAFLALPIAASIPVVLTYIREEANGSHK